MLEKGKCSKDNKMTMFPMRKELQKNVTLKENVELYKLLF